MAKLNFHVSLLAVAWELELIFHHCDWLKFPSVKYYPKLCAAVKRTVKLQGALRWKYFQFGIRENSPEPQNSNGKPARWFIDSIDSGESIFWQQPAMVFDKRRGWIRKLFFACAGEISAIMNCVRLTLVETGKNVEVLSPRSTATDPRDRILRQRLSEVRLNGRFQLNTVNFWEDLD